MKLHRQPFAPLLLTLLALIAASELLVGTLVYRRLRQDLESDLAARLVHAPQLLALSVDPALLRQFGEGDLRLPAYELVRSRIAAQAQAAGVEGAYAFDTERRTLVDSQGLVGPGRVRHALMAHRAEVARAAAGTPASTRLYRDEGGRLRLSAFAPVRRGTAPIDVLVGVDASPVFFESLAALRRQMLLLGASSLVLVGLAGFAMMRQVGGRLARLRRAMAEAGRGDLTVRAEVSGADEIGALGEDLDRMIATMVGARDEYAAVLGSLDVGLLTCDEAGEITLANGAVRRLLAATGEMVGRPVHEALAREPALASFVAEARTAGQPASAELPLGGGLPGGGRVIAAAVSPLRRTEGSGGCVLSLLDVTERRELERRARGNERLAMLGGTAGGLLHEIRNPLASMMVYLDLLRSPLAGLAEPRELLDAALREGERLTRFLEDFQVFAGLRPLREGTVLVASVLEAALAGIRWPEGVALHQRLGEATLHGADRRLLEHGLRNLLQNAIEALAGRAGVVEVAVVEERAEAVVSVGDDGPGIPPAELERILDPLFTTKPRGTGLGLSIVQRVVELHAGTVAVSSPPGRGATFTLRLPTGKKEVR